PRDRRRKRKPWPSTEELGAPVAVLLHDLPELDRFSVVDIEAHGAGEDGVGHADLADVVERRRQPELRSLLVGVAELQAEALADGADALQMDAGRPVVRFGGRRQ